MRFLNLVILAGALVSQARPLTQNEPLSCSAHRRGIRSRSGVGGKRGVDGQAGQPGQSGSSLGGNQPLNGSNVSGAPVVFSAVSTSMSPGRTFYVTNPASTAAKPTAFAGSAVAGATGLSSAIRSATLLTSASISSSGRAVTPTPSVLKATPSTTSYSVKTTTRTLTAALITVTSTIYLNMPTSGRPSTPTSTAGATVVIANPKRGLVYNDGALTRSFTGSKNIVWAYNWEASRGALSSSIEYIPMYWGPDSDQTAVQRSVLAEKAKHLLTYNEPDMPGAYGGSNMTPEAGWAAWKSQILPYRNVSLLGSPGISSYNTTSGLAGHASGLTWLRQFILAAGGAQNTGIQFVALHWYGNGNFNGSDQGELFMQYIQAANKDITRMFGRSMPIWITEFSPLPLGNQSIATDFLDAVLPFLDSYAPVERYSFFMTSPGNLVDSSGSSLSQSGVRYSA